MISTKCDKCKKRLRVAVVMSVKIILSFALYENIL